MNQYFPHEKLDVYTRALTFVQLAVPLIDAWPSTVSVRDQLDRASESLITNLVKAVRLRHTSDGIYCLECSLGSVLECAACLDVARVSRLIDPSQLDAGKQLLQAVARMEVGLRSSWYSTVRESTEPEAGKTKYYFPHESLKVYQRALQLYASLASSFLVEEIKRHRFARRIDELSTSLVLNIAEGNGRFSHPDHGKFVDIAEESGIKLAAYLDLAATTWEIDSEPAKSLLREVLAMLAGLKGYLEAGREG
jgi:four helix bundle protein